MGHRKTGGGLRSRPELRSYLDARPYAALHPRDAFLRVGDGSLNNPSGLSVLAINEENETGETDFK
jgi:hypothetical protein